MPKKGVLEQQIRQVLQADEASRNYDYRLTQVLWWKFYQSSFIVIGGVAHLPLTELPNLPSQDNIKRIRAKIQNDMHEFLPTTLEIALKRRISEEEWREYLYG